MKKSLFFVAAATLVLASCNNDVKLDENVALEGSNAQKEIALTPYAQKAKHLPAESETTPVVEDAIYPDNLVMQVAAYAQPISSTSWTAGGYFDKTPFKGTNAANWKGVPARYWPLSDAYVTFLAVAGVDDDDVAFAASTFASGATVKYTATSFGAQTDLMYSGKQASVTKAGNALTFPTTVPMTFHHALALVKFNVRAASATYAGKFAITKIVVNNAEKTGTYTITNTGYATKGSDPTPSGTWGNDPQDWTTADYDVDASAIAKGSLTAAYQACGQALLVPRSTGAFTKFTIHYTLDDKAFTFDYTPESTILAQATKYVYNITFTLHEIIIDPEVAPWTDGGTEYVEIPANPMAYGTNYSVVATADAQILKFKINGFTAASGNQYKVTCGGTDAAQVTETTPTTTAVDLPGTSAAVTATILANTSAADKTFTLTIQEVDGGGANVGTATVITVTQAH